MKWLHSVKYAHSSDDEEVWGRSVGLIVLYFLGLIRVAPDRLSFVFRPPVGGLDSSPVVSPCFKSMPKVNWPPTQAEQSVGTQGFHKDDSLFLFKDCVSFRNKQF